MNSTAEMLSINPIKIGFRLPNLENTYPLKIFDSKLKGILQKSISETVERAVSGFIWNYSSKKKMKMNRQKEESTIDVKNVRYMLRIVVSFTPSLQFRKSIRFLNSC